MDTRHIQRIAIVQNIFSYGFSPHTTDRFPYLDKSSKESEETLRLYLNDSGKENLDDIEKRVFATSGKIISNLTEIDKKISSLAVKFPIEKIAKIDLAILRLAVFELTVEKKEPQRVVINEAVELAKELGGDKSYAFINGVLGKLIENK